MDITRSRKPKQDESWPRKITFGRESVTVYKRLTPAGKIGFLVANYSGSKRRLDSYSSENEALEAANKLAKQLSQRDVVSASMTRNQSIEFASATQSLQPFGITLSAAVAAIVEGVKLTGDLPTLAAAVRFYKAKHKTLTPKAVSEVVTELLALKKSRGVSERYLADLKFRLEKFAAAFQCNIGNVTTPAVQDWLDGQKLSSQSYSNNRTVAHLLCQYAVSRHYAHDNPVAEVDKVKINNAECEVFTPNEAAKLLAHATDEFLPCLALGLFAGIRSAELERLKWEDVKESHVVVGKDAAKTASRRIVPIADNLALWLKPFAGRQGNIWPHGRTSFHKHEHSTAKAAGLRWKRNAMRHSFASYSLALCNDAGRVAGMCGNSPKVIHRHYKQLCTQAEAAKFFEIKPLQTLNNNFLTAPMLESVAV